MIEDAENNVLGEMMNTTMSKLSFPVPVTCR